jgi:hypothetical protein
MKKLILAMTVMLTIGLTSVYANKKEEINKEVAASFSKDFPSAQNVMWNQQQQYEEATFTLNGQVMFAYYSEDGKLQAVSRNVLSDHLPVLLLVNLKKIYSNYWISDLMERTSENQTAWYIKLENAYESLILKSGEYNQWNVYKRIKKE